MFEALKQWRGESSSDSQAVERLMAAAKRESRLRRESILHGATSTFFRDPFADDPNQLIPVRREDRELLDNLREASRARADVVQARAEAAAARAEAEAAKAEAARAERAAARAEELAVRRQGEATQVGCADRTAREEDGAAGSSGTLEGMPSRESVRRVHRFRSHRHESRQATTLGGPIAGAERHRAAPRDQPPPPADEPSHRPPAGWTSADSRGILVVPIEVSISQARKTAQLR